MKDKMKIDQLHYDGTEKIELRYDTVFGNFFRLDTVKVSGKPHDSILVTVQDGRGSACVIVPLTEIKEALRAIDKFFA